jgi:hypothetical protein
MLYVYRPYHSLWREEIYGSYREIVLSAQIVIRYMYKDSMIIYFRNRAIKV